jgi:hypothetical protein
MAGSCEYDDGHSGFIKFGECPIQHRNQLNKGLEPRTQILGESLLANLLVLGSIIRAIFTVFTLTIPLNPILKSHITTVTSKPLESMP